MGDKLIDVAKGIIAAADFSVSSTMPRNTVNRLISAVVDDDFLKKIRVVQISSLEVSLPVFDIAARQMQRVPEGADPSDFVDSVPLGKDFKALPVQFFPTIGESAVLGHGDNPSLKSDLEKAFVTSFRNDLTDLAFNGEGDDYTGATQEEKWLNLNKGYIHLAKNSARTKKVNINFETDGYVKSFQKIAKASDHRFRANSRFIVSPNTALGWAEQVGLHSTDTTITKSPVLTHMGQGLEVCPYMSDDDCIYSPLNNLIIVIVNNSMKKVGEYDGRQRAFKYTISSHVDFGFGIDDAVTIGQHA